MFDVRFKKKVVREYLSGQGGYKILAARYDIADSLVRRWVGADHRHAGSSYCHYPGMHDACS